MNITKDTTDDELLAPVRLAKIALNMATGAGNVDTNASDRLAELVNNVASHEGALAARYEYRNALAQGATEADIRKHLMRLVTNGPNDTYSGRRNDVRRAHNDGLREEVAKILTLLDRTNRTTA